MSVVRRSELEGSHRIDAEYYDVAHLQIRHGVAQSPYPVKPLGELSKSIINFGAYSLCNFIEFRDEGIPYLTAREIGENSIKWGTARFISEEQHANLLRKSQIHKGQVLVSMAGRLGVSCVFDEDFACNSSQDVAKVTLKAGLNPYYVSAFINSKYGSVQLLGAQTGSVQHHTNLGIIKTIRIIVLPLPQQEKIAAIIKRANEESKESESLYAQAQTLLAAELGLDKLDLSESLYSVRRVSEVQKDGRMDAEHFREKYYRAMEVVRSLKLKAMLPLGELVDSMTNGHTPLHHSLDVGEIPFLTAEHVFDFRLNFDTDKRVLAEHHKNELARTQLCEDDVLITIKGKVGNAAVVENLPGPTNINQDVALLRLKAGYHPYYIAGFLNCPAGKALTERISTGQINPFLGLGNLSQVLIPTFEENRMRELGEELGRKVREAERARQDAQRLLAEAKAQVEKTFEVL